VGRVRFYQIASQALDDPRVVDVAGLNEKLRGAGPCGEQAEREQDPGEPAQLGNHQ